MCHFNSNCAVIYQLALKQGTEETSLLVGVQCLWLWRETLAHEFASPGTYIKQAFVYKIKLVMLLMKLRPN